jgi:hypothetical protein
MGQQQPIRVVVERKGGAMSGCGTAVAVIVLLGLTIEYWYVALAIAAVVAVVVIANTRKQRATPVHRPGPRDPWLNEVTVALAELGLAEMARNTGAELCGVEMEGDVGLQTERFLVYVNLFSDQRLARQAELGLCAKPKVRDAIATGATAIKTTGRIVFVASGRGGVVDEFRLEEVVRVVERTALPPSLAPARVRSAPSVPSPDPDVLEQLRKLGDLRKAGVVTDAEFAAKKAELLGRL